MRRQFNNYMTYKSGYLDARHTYRFSPVKRPRTLISSRKTSLFSWTVSGYQETTTESPFLIRFQRAGNMFDKAWLLSTVILRQRATRPNYTHRISKMECVQGCSSTQCNVSLAGNIARGNDVDQYSFITLLAFEGIDKVFYQVL